MGNKLDKKAFFLESRMKEMLIKTLSFHSSMWRQDSNSLPYAYMWIGAVPYEI